jgi:UDP-GlcNAc:undecaprenyl-phosphate/decaprenyl-phosphate GlcNAc-1-phosphate transferase
MIQISNLGLIFVAALLTSLCATPLVIRVALQNSLLDRPGERRVHTQPVPRLGGVAVFVATLVGLGLAVALGWMRDGINAPLVVGLVLGGGILFVTGLVDDVRTLSPRGKLVGQLLAAGVVYALGFRIELLSIWPSTDYSVGWLSLPLTLLWIVGVTNAFNLIDGLDGLATGIAIVALGTTLMMALMMGQADVAITAVALLGALVGFLVFNFNPARIFLGDSGSLFVGFMLATLSVHGSTKASTAVLAIVPLLALFLPLADTFLAMARRWLRGVAMSSPDGRHIHHRLLDLGLTHRTTVVVLYVVAAALAAVGMLAVASPPERVVVITAAGGGLSLILLLVGLRGLDYHEFAEARAVIAVAPAKFRRVIRDRIHARDVARIISTAETLAVVNAILEDNAAIFGFARLEVRPAEGVSGLIPGAIDHDLWWIVRPLAPRVGGQAPLALVIWCGHGAGANRPFGVERVASILAPVLSKWIAARHPARELGVQKEIHHPEAAPDMVKLAI